MKLNEIYVQTKLIKGCSQFDCIGEKFTITEINDGIATLKCNDIRMGFCADEEVLNECFELYVSDVEKECEENNVKLIFSDNVVVAILPTGEKGIAKCLDCDTYDRDKGIEIALTKAKIKKLNKKLKKLSE